MALALLVVISGPQKSWFLGPNPYIGPSNGFASLKIIKSKRQWKIATGINETCGKFATGVNDTTPVANNRNNIRLLTT